MGTLQIVNPGNGVITILTNVKQIVHIVIPILTVNTGRSVIHPLTNVN